MYMAKKKQIGGARPGAGRKVGPDGPAVLVTVSLPERLVEQMDAVAETEGWGRSKAIGEALRLLFKRKKRA